MDSNARNTLLVETYCELVRGFEDHVFQPYVTIKDDNVQDTRGETSLFVYVYNVDVILYYIL
jgi:hypothetical protein